MNIKKELDKFIDVIKVQDKNDDVKEGDLFYSFKIEHIRDNSKCYKVLSDSMEGLSCDEETQYMQMYYCLEALNEHAFKIIEDLKEFDYMELVEADIYTSDLTKWLNKSNLNVGYIEHVEDKNDLNGFDILSKAQYLCHYDIWSAVIYAIIDHLESLKK